MIGSQNLAEIISDSMHKQGNAERRIYERFKNQKQMQDDTTKMIILSI